jgi:hypothetical protein
MDELIESLPTIEDKKIYVIDDCKTVWYWDDSGEGAIDYWKQMQYDKNVMTAAQVNAAKEKGWQPYYNEYFFFDENDDGVVEGYEIVDEGWREFQGRSARGDVNGDGEVNVGDLVCVSNYMAGDDSVSKDAADVNQDGEVNVGDMVVISNIMSGNE